MIVLISVLNLPPTSKFVSYILVIQVHLAVLEVKKLSFVIAILEMEIAVDPV